MKKIISIFTVLLLFQAFTLAKEPEMVKDLCTEFSDDSSPDNLIDAGNFILFTYDDYSHGRELWRSDGTVNGTYLVKDITTGTKSTFFYPMYNADGIVYIILKNGTEDNWQLWKSDGTEGGTTQIIDLGSNIGGGLFLGNYNGAVYFSNYSPDNGYELWKTDGTESGTEMVKDINPGTGNSISYIWGTMFNGILYFAADDGTHGTELWRTNGTEAGTYMVKDINSGGSGYIQSTPSDMTVFNGELFFSADDGIHGRELWKTDGTEAGTSLFVDLEDYTGGSKPHDLTVNDGTLFFVAEQRLDSYPYTDRELWKTDGTESGTMMVKDINVSKSYYPDILLVYNNEVYLEADDGTHGNELWKSNGTEAGTFMVKDIAENLDDYNNYISIINSCVANNKVFFTAYNRLQGIFDLWMTNGTESGTEMLKAGIKKMNSNNLVSSNGYAFFSYPDETYGFQLWRTDGTESGTVMLTSNSGTTYSSYPRSFNIIGDEIYFLAQNYELDNVGNTSVTKVLARSDGTEGGTEFFTDETGPNMAFAFTEYNGAVYFVGGDDTYGFELWKTDGTNEGTERITDLNPGTENFCEHNPNLLFKFGGNLIFPANDGTHGMELWKSDGTAQGTQLIKDIFPGNGSSVDKDIPIVEMGGYIYFPARTPEYGWELWKSDGTEQNTVMVKEIYQNLMIGNWLYEIVVLNNIIYFSADDGVHGSELWRSDGTEEGTYLVKDIYEGSYSGGVGDFMVIGNELYFIANDETYGPEIWKTDGTENGTVRITDFQGESYRSGPSQFIEINGKLFIFYFTGTPFEYELWCHDLTTQQTNKVLDTIFGIIWSKDVINGLLFFMEEKDDGIMDLWQSDGTEEGTFVISEIHWNPKAGLIYSPKIIMREYLFSGPVILNDKLFFPHDDGYHGEELWVYDPALVIDISDKSSCMFSPTQLAHDEEVDGGSHNYTAYWDPSTGLDDPDVIETVVENPTTSREYTLYVHDNVTGEDVQETIMMNVYPQPIVAGLIPMRMIRRNQTEVDLAPNLRVSNGTEPYIYSWTDKNGWASDEANPVVSPSVDTDYYLTITDGNGCSSDEKTVSVVVKNGRIAAPGEILSNGSALNLYPNPAIDEVTLNLELNEISDVEIRVSDILGEEKMSIALSNIKQLSRVIKLDGLTSGTYLLEIRIGNEIFNRKIVKM